MTVQELEVWIKEYGRSIYAFCRKLCLSNEAAEELYQEVWLSAMQRLGKLKADQNVKSYLLSLAVGIWRNQKKKYAVRQRIAPEASAEEVDNEPVDRSGDGLEQLLQQERRRAVRAAVVKLEDIYRIPVLLYYMEGQSVRDIARALHVPEGTVKRRLWTARKKLSEELEEYVDG